MPHYFFRWKLSASLFLQKKNKHLPFFYVSEENQAPHYFFREKWSASLLLQKNQPFFKDIVRHFIVCQKKYQKNSKVFYFFWRNIKKNNLANVVATIKNKVPHYFFRRNEVPGSFIRKKSSASLVFPKKMKCLIISSEKNASSSFQKSVKRLIISSPKIKCLISFFWQNNETLHFVLKK